jgi:hypothetical protein
MTTQVEVQEVVVQELVVQEPVVQEPVVNEEVWRTWVKKGRLHEQAAARKFKIAGVVVAVVAAGGAFYWMR